jgi:hypothetical protein
MQQKDGEETKAPGQTAIGYGLDVTQKGGRCHVYAGRGVDTDVRVGRWPDWPDFPEGGAVAVSV